MIKPRPMARHRRFDVAQRIRPRQLTEQQRQQLPLGRETAHQCVGPALLHKPLKDRPGKQFQNVAENRIRMGHGADPFHVQASRQTLEMIRINAVRFAQKNRTGQPWDKPGHDGVRASFNTSRSPRLRIASSRPAQFHGMINHHIGDRPMPSVKVAITLAGNPAPSRQLGGAARLFQSEPRHSNRVARKDRAPGRRASGGGVREARSGVRAGAR